MRSSAHRSLECEGNAAAMEKRILVVSALVQEIRPLAARLGLKRFRAGMPPVSSCSLPGKRIFLGATGDGIHRSRGRLRAWLGGIAVNQVLSIGFAGALTDNLKSATLVHCTEALMPSEDCGEQVIRPVKSALNDMLTQCKDLVSCRWFTAEQVVSGSKEKKALARSTGAEVVEMETGAIFQECNALGIPCAAVRVILDDAELEIAPDIGDLVDQFGNVRWRSATAGVLNRPGVALDMLRLGRLCSPAVRRLSDFTLKLLQEL